MNNADAYVRQLCGYLSNNRDIALHTNRNWGTKITAADVERIRSTMPKRKRA